MSGYRIADEPLPGPLARIAVNPIFPLLAMMLGGCWLGWTWFVLNAFAVGSPTRLRETAWIVAGFAGTAILVIGLGVGLHAGSLGQDATALKVARLLLVLWKLAISYRVQFLQSRTVALFEYFGGKLHNGFFVLVAGFILQPRLAQAIPGGLLSAVLF